MIIKKNLGLINKKNRINLTIGTFDAFHKGHLKILNTLIKTSKQDKAKSCVITFQNRPKHFLKQKSNGIILSNKDRIIFFKKFKINYLFYLEFTKKFACITAEDFIYKLINLFNVNKIIIGNDFKFGYGNKGNVTTLQKLQSKLYFQLLVIKNLNSNGTKISTTMIKSFIKKGNIQKANILLGREYFINTKVIKGKGIGAKIGFPTINVQPEEKIIALPKNGVYVSKIKYNNIFYYGMTFIGINNFSKKFVIETNIFNFHKNLYNKKIMIFFIKKLRKEIKFVILNELKKQLLIDKKQAIRIINNNRSFAYEILEEP